MATSYNVFSLDEAEQFIQINENAWWDNYDIIIWKKNPGAWSKKNGKLYNGKWGNIIRIPISSEGTWRMPSGVRSI
jgi:hypothetical protein